MFTWFSSAPAKKAVLILQPDERGRKHAGFVSGEPLKLDATEGETVGAVMDRFNTYRGPTEQITTVYSEPSATKVQWKVPFSTKITGTMTVIIS